MKTDSGIKRVSGLPDEAGIDVKTVAALCGCSVSTVWERAKRGALPKPIKIGGSARWNLGQLRKCLMPEAA